MRWNPGTKYRNQRTEIDGIKFDSKGEANRWCELKLMEKAGQITNLRRQIAWELIPNQYAVVEGCRKCLERRVTYVADFVYQRGGELIVEDYKGIQTEAFKIKKKLMLWRYGIEVRLTRE